MRDLLRDPQKTVNRQALWDQVQECLAFHLRWVWKDLCWLRIQGAQRVYDWGSKVLRDVYWEVEGAEEGVERVGKEGEKVGGGC